MRRIGHIFSSFLISAVFVSGLLAWSWNSAENVLPSLREDLDKEIAAYRQQVGTGMSIHERILALDRIVGNYKPLGLNVVDLETERSRLMLQDRQQQLRSAQVQDEASLLYEKGVAEYKDGQYQVAMETFREAERLLPQDSAIKEVRRKLESITPIIEKEDGSTRTGELIKLAILRYLENDPKRAMNALIYVSEKVTERREIPRLLQLIESNHPEIEAPKVAAGVGIVDHKMQLALEAIYDGRYLSAISECTDVLDLEPQNVLAMTRLGSAYYAMNEATKAKQVWTKALQLDPNNDILRRFLYGKQGAPRVE